MSNEIIGHARMCVRMKLRKDERDFNRRSDRLTLEQAANHHARIDRGVLTLAWLKQMEKKNE